MIEPVPHLRPVAHLKFEPAGSRGRRYPEPEHEYRNPFERDRHRVIYSRAFRRLEGKTQVFDPRRGDHFRNRLTHTLEVAQISRTAASVLGLNVDLAETLALAHDIGHPPFGHAGESELDRQLSVYGERFDHNRHALHLVEAFEQRYPLFPGLNLMYEVREGLLKHSRDWPEEPQLAAYRLHERPPLEAQLIDFTDEIAYNAADLEDAFLAGLLSLDQAAAATPFLAETVDALEQQMPGASGWMILQTAVRALVDHLVTGLIQGTSEAAGAVATVAELRLLPHRVARYSPEAAATTALLKAFLKREVYESADIQNGRATSVRHMGDLFEHLMANPGDLPAAYREDAAHRPLHQVVRDYLAGMTDAFFLRAYADLLGV
jgi:dGTPase